MRFHTLLLVIAFAVPSLAVRGGDLKTRKNVVPRDLQADPKEGPVAPSKADPKAADKAKEDPKKSDKKCKKAKKQKDKKKKDGRRGLQVPPKKAAGPAADDVRFCLHKEFAEGECDNVQNLPRSGKVGGDLNIEIVHEGEESADGIVEEIKEILFGEDTNKRYVGCEDMKAPPKKKDGRIRRRMAAARRHLEYTLVDEQHDMVDVTGIDFKDVKIDQSACAVESTTDGTESSKTCDVIKSSVEIFFDTDGDDELSEADKQDMYDLLAETILSSSEAGSFKSIGEVTYVQAAADLSDEDGTRSQEDGNMFGSTGGSDGDKKEGSGSIPIVVPIAAVAAIAGGAYYMTSKKDDDGEKPEQDTSDSDEDDERRERR